MSCIDCTPIAAASYATLEDLQEAGMPLGAIGSVPLKTQEKALERASRYADTYLRDRYTLPLAAPFDQSLVDAVVQIASWRLMQRRGFNPNTPGDATIRMGFEDAENWLKRIANGQAQLCVTQSYPQSYQPQVGSAAPRGWGGLTNSEDVPFVGTNMLGV